MKKTAIISAKTFEGNSIKLTIEIDGTNQKCFSTLKETIDEELENEVDKFVNNCRCHFRDIKRIK